LKILAKLIYKRENDDVEIWNSTMKYNDEGETEMKSEVTYKVYDNIQRKIIEIDINGKEITKQNKIKEFDKQIITIMKQQYKERQFNYGLYDFDHIKDLNDGSRRKLYKSEIRYSLLYGSEWSAIRNEIRIRYKFTCQECGRTFEGHNLHTHHIKEISKYLQQGIGIMKDEHECYGIMTNKPWHTEDNLILLCQDCHADKHLHMIRKNLKEEAEIRNTFKQKKSEYKLKYIDKKELEEQKLRIRKMFENQD